MHWVIEVFEVAEPLSVITSLAVVAEDEGAGEKTPTLGTHLENGDAARSFDQPEDEGDNNDHRVCDCIKQSLITRASCPFTHIDLDIRGGGNGSLEEEIHNLWCVVDADEHDESIEGIPASQELWEEG